MKRLNLINLNLLCHWQLKDGDVDNYMGEYIDDVDMLHVRILLSLINISDEPTMTLTFGSLKYS
jgi:hypothetical protein